MPTRQPGRPLAARISGRDMYPNAREDFNVQRIQKMQARIRLLSALVAGMGAGMSGTSAHADADADADVHEMEEMVVTATKTAKDSADAPATVSVVTRKEIEGMNVQSVDESLAYLPGVYTQRPGGHEPSVMGTNVLLRGIPNYSRSLVLVDGQTLNDPYIGVVTWESVPAETVERIEVVPGPFSSLYGGSAMGGVINIITQAPTRRALSLKAGYGSNDFMSGSLVYQDRIGERLGVVFDYAYKRSDGYVKDEVVVAPGTTAGTVVTGAQQTTDTYGNTRYLIGDKGDSAWDSENIGVKLYLDLPADSRLTLGVSRFTYGSFDRNDFNAYLRDASGNPVSLGNVTLSGTTTHLVVRQSAFLTGPDMDVKEQNRYTLEFDKKLGKGAALKATLGYLDIPLYNNYIVPSASATVDGGPATRLLRPNSEASGAIQVSVPVSERHYLVAGIAAGQREIETVTYSIGDWRDASATDVIKNRTGGEDRYFALYAQDEITVSDQVTAYLGGRYDYWTTEGFIEQMEMPGAYRTDYGARSQDYFSPKVSVVYRPQDATTLRASVGSAFHTPVLRDTFGWWTPSTGKIYEPNPDLKPETVTSWEVGAEQQLGTGTLLRATYFENYLQDLIYRTEDATTQSIANAGEAEVKGLELEVRQRIGNGLTAFVNATFNDPKITENAAKPATQGKFMTQTPRKMANVGLQGTQGPWSGSLTGHYAGKIYGNDENKDTYSGVYGSYDAYFVVNAKVAYTVRKGLKLSLSADNLLDREYYASSKAMGRAIYGEIAWQM